jgi:hypothetical protein
VGGIKSEWWAVSIGISSMPALMPCIKGERGAFRRSDAINYEDATSELHYKLR